MKYFVLCFAALVLCSGCKLLDKNPDFTEKLLILGSFSRADISGDGDATMTDIRVEVDKFQDAKLGYGGAIKYWGLNSGGAMSLTTIGPTVRYLHPLEETKGVVPYGGGSIGIVQTKASFGGMSDTQSGLYIRAQVGVFLFLQENWLIDLSLSFTSMMLDETQNDLSLGAAIGVLFGEGKKENPKK